MHRLLPCPSSHRFRLRDIRLDTVAIDARCNKALLLRNRTGGQAVRLATDAKRHSKVLWAAKVAPSPRLAAWDTCAPGQWTLPLLEHKCAKRAHDQFQYRGRSRLRRLGTSTDSGLSIGHQAGHVDRQQGRSRLLSERYDHAGYVSCSRSIAHQTGPFE